MGAMGFFVRWCVGLAKPTTQTTDAERDCLAKHAAGSERVVEIGVWHGVTTCRLLAAMDPAGTLLAVDPYFPGRLGFSTQKVIAHSTVRRRRYLRRQLRGRLTAVGLRDVVVHAETLILGDYAHHGEAWQGD